MGSARTATANLAVAAGLAIALLTLPSCTTPPTETTINAQAGAPETNPPTKPTTPTTDPTSTTTTTPPGADTANPLTAARARDVITTLTRQGHTPAFAACVLLKAKTGFTPTQTDFIDTVLALENPTDEQTRAAVAATGITDQDKAPLPDAIHAIFDTCTPLDQPRR